MKFVEQFTHLHFITTRDDSADHHVLVRIEKAADAMKLLSRRLLCREAMCRKIMMKMFNALVISILLHSSDTRPLAVQQTKKLNTFGMKCFIE